MQVDGRVFDRVTQEWLLPEEKRKRDEYWEEVAFQRQGNQGQLSAPMFITDTMRAVQSQTDGKMYDSKSMLRREYKRAGVIEVGNDVQTKRAEPTREEKRRKVEARRGAMASALSKVGFGA